MYSFLSASQLKITPSLPTMSFSLYSELQLLANFKNSGDIFSLLMWSKRGDFSTAILTS